MGRKVIPSLGSPLWSAVCIQKDCSRGGGGELFHPGTKGSRAILAYL